jgi:hypothetical protein
MRHRDDSAGGHLGNQAAWAGAAGYSPFTLPGSGRPAQTKPERPTPVRCRRRLPSKGNPFPKLKSSVATGRPRPKSGLAAEPRPVSNRRPEGGSHAPRPVWGTSGARKSYYSKRLCTHEGTVEPSPNNAIGRRENYWCNSSPPIAKPLAGR